MDRHLTQADLVKYKEGDVISYNHYYTQSKDFGPGWFVLKAAIPNVVQVHEWILFGDHHPPFTMTRLDLEYQHVYGPLELISKEAYQFVCNFYLPPDTRRR